VSIRKALIFSLLDRNASLVIGIASSMALARLLTPTDIGVFSVTMVLLSFVTTFRDFGAGQYLVQTQSLTPDRIRAVWTLQLGIGVFIALLSFGASFPVSDFYHEPRMRDIMWVLGLSYLVNPFGSLTYAWLMRSLKFETLAFMRFTSTLAGALVSIFLAWKGLGPISLAWGNLATICTNAFIATFYRPRDFPLLPGIKEIKVVASFGARLTSTSIIETLTQGAPELILAKLQNLTDVGMFSRANGLMALFSRLVSDAVASVAVPMFAQASREGTGLAASFLKANMYMTALAWAFAGSVAVLAQPLIAVLYGPQWHSAVAVTQWLACAAAVVAPASLCYQVLVGAGALTRLLRIMAVASFLTVLGAAIGAWFSLITMTWCLIAAGALSSLAWLWMTRLELGFAWSALLRGQLHSLLVALGAIVPVALVQWASSSQGWPNLVTLLASALVGGIGLLAFVLGFRHPMADEIRPLLARLRRA